MQLNINFQKELQPLYDAIERMEKKLDAIAPLMKGDLLNDHQLKEMFNVSTRTIINWRQNGKLQFVKVGSVIFYTKEQVL